MLSKEARQHVIAALALAAALLWSAGAALAVQVQDLVRIKGGETSKLVGMGIVFGLPGTGDGGKFLPAMRPLATVIQQFIDPNTVAAELKDAKNVALVYLSATLPASGVREGDRVDIHVSVAGPCKSLKGGRLFLVPMTGPLPGSPVMAYAEGAISIEDELTPTTGVVKQGGQLTTDIFAQYLDDRGRITFVLNEEVAGWPVANTLAGLINDTVAPDGPNLARAVGPKNIVVIVPDFERAEPATFISAILQSYVDPSQISVGARVRINEKTGTIIFGAEVQISPVVISHKGLTITTTIPAVSPSPAQPMRETQPWVAIDPDQRGGARLGDLLDALKQLKVDAPDRIAIVKELYEIGKLHAQLVIE
jgi:flagellar P-ring protein precursor FlgI